MGITLKKALEVSDKNIAKLKAEKQKLKDDVLKKVYEEIDFLISVNISTIMEKPVSFTISTPLQEYYEYVDEIRNNYHDFTISTPLYWSLSFGVKLADKDWDWDGYGIKKQQEQQEEKKENKTFFNFLHKIFN